MPCRAASTLAGVSGDRSVSARRLRVACASPARRLRVVCCVRSGTSRAGGPFGRALWLQYLQSWFLLDLVSTLPWDLMFEAINQSSEADVGTDDRK
jgi:hypothetical protein